ncbi:DNA polymerase [Streptomyces malaysiensis]|uniref:DNA polymerase I n=1 Tax=Streptomyces malaysiensis TaxID=92644 RepID=A0A7X5X7F7_STRMQ|nr:DNA polymerase [Streptomyces malaysiensis]NIY68026.1 DNA polymerase I PolA [Streptomyces malaysiensis]
MHQLVTSVDQLHDVVHYFEDRDSFAFDVETVGTHRSVPAVNEITWLTVATDGACSVIPMGHPNGNLLKKATRRKNKATGTWDHFPAEFDAPPKQLRPSQVFSVLKPLFFSDRLKVAHNAPFDLLSVAKYFPGRSFPPPPYGDTIVAAWLLDENRLLGLKSLDRHRYGLDYDHDDTGKAVEKHPFGQVHEYAWMDGQTTWLQWRHMRPQITTEGLEDMWALEMDVLHCLLHMGAGGVPIDIEALKALRARLRSEMEHAEAEVYRAAGRVFNIGSVPQKQKILYEEQGLKPRKRTKKGAPSTDADALAPYAGRNRFVDSLLNYQDVSKIHSTYVEGYLGNDDKPTQIFNGRIYPILVQYGTVTGRFSCRAPNVQNWPRAESEWGKAIRDLVDPIPGFKLLVADYAQIEQRILAHFAGKGALWQGFWDGVDAHTATAAAVFGVAPEDVTKQMRQVAKAIAFAINYGAGAQKVADMSHTTLHRAKQILAEHERQFAEVYAYKRKLLRTVRSRRPVPYLRTLLGRKRRLPDLLSHDHGLRAKAERQVVNSHIQGSNADMTKRALVRLHQNLLPDMQILLTVHDEIAAMCPADMAEEGAKVLHWAMAGEAMQLLSVPVTTDVKICDRWSEAK